MTISKETIEKEKPEETEEVKPEVKEVKPEKQEPEIKKEETGEEPPAPEYITVKELYQTCVVVSLVSVLVTMTIYHQFFAQRIETFDLTNYIGKIQQAYVAGTINEQGMGDAIQQAADYVNGRPRNRVVVSGESILGDAKSVKRLIIEPKFQPAPAAQLQQQAPAMQLAPAQQPQMPQQQMQPGVR